MASATIELPTEFEGVGAHQFNPRFDFQPDEHQLDDVEDNAGDMPALHAAIARFLLSATAVPIRLDGPDVSHYQEEVSPIRWVQVVGSGCWWGATKLTQSIAYLDPTAARSRLGMFGAGMRMLGMYHWVSPSTDPLAQAAWYLTHLGALRVGEFVMLDVEEAGVNETNTAILAEEIERHAGRPCVIYSGAFVSSGTIWQSARLRWSRVLQCARPFILAAYTSEATALALPGIRNFPWHAWQFSSNGPVTGISGRCDMNRVDDKDAFAMACGLVMGGIIPSNPSTIGEDMAIIITAPNRNPALLDAGYATGVGPLTMAGPNIPVVPLDDGVWDQVVANSNAKKAADLAMGAGFPAPAAGNTALGASGYSGTITLTPNQ